MKIEKICIKNDPDRPELGIHIIADYDPEAEREEALLVQGIKPGGRIATDGRLEVGDRIEEINEVSLLGVDFSAAQEIFRQALSTPELRLKVVKNFIDKRYIPPPVSESYPPSSLSPTSSSDRTPSLGSYQKDTFSVASLRVKQLIDLKHSDSDVSDKNVYTYKNVDCDPNSGLVIPNERPVGSIVVPKQASITSIKNNKPTTEQNVNGTPPKPAPGSFQGLVSMSNTRKIGKRHVIDLVKDSQGLGFTVTTRDNPAGSQIATPIFIKTILAYGSAVQDGRLRPGDRLLEVNGIEMTGKSQDEAVQILRNIPPGGIAKLIVSRQDTTSESLPSPKTPRVLPIAPSVESLVNIRRDEYLTFEIPLNDTQSAGLGFSVKGKQTNSGIFVLQIFNGGAAKKGKLIRQESN